MSASKRSCLLAQRRNGVTDNRQLITESRLPSPIPVSLRSFTEYVNHDHARDEASHMRPESNPARSLAGFGDGRGRAAQKISHEPVPEHQPCRNMKQKYRRKPDEHSRPRIQDE